VTLEIARVKLTAKSLATLLVIYGAVISTLAIFLALRANSLTKKTAKDAGPVFTIGWSHDGPLTVSMRNSGNTEITINELSLGIMRQVSTRSGPGGLTVNTRTDPIEEIPKERWWEGYESNKLPVRLPPRVEFPILVNRKGIGPLPADIPPNELILRFVANKPDGGYEFDDISLNTARIDG
jgi:hypothetical protein